VTAFYPYWGALAENIHAVVGVDRVVTDWKNSAGHNVNMMNATYNDVGVGCMYASNGVIYWALELGWNGANT
ncbi:MAG: CAP domain-containing protein, partial [Actinomycetota bacterium]|nr:CAP domain-containing protein [Actinomycetota bacterium]